MGVKDLVGWISKHHPEIITTLPSRWDTPSIRGKRIALDATLITNRFHIADRQGRYNGKAALLGWHGGIQPIAVWDERGVREWKAPERQASRARVLARKLHEDRRAIRLSRLRDELQYAHLFLEPVSQIWGKALLAPTPPIQHDQPRNVFAAPLDLANDDVVTNILYVSLFASHTASLRSLYEECVDEMTRASRGSPEEDTEEPEPLASDGEEEASDAVPAVEEVEAGAAAEQQPVGSSSIATDVETADEAEDRALSAANDAATATEEDESCDILEDAVIEDDSPGGEAETADLDATDRRLLSIEPSTEYVETPRQEALSLDELELYSLLFDSGDAPISPGDAVDLARQVLDGMIKRAATVRETYVGSLNVPQEKDHAACRELLHVMGVPIVIANIPYEAEGLASALVQRGQADFVGSEDSDVVVYGVPLLRNLANSGQPLSHIDSAGLRAKLGWSFEHFLDFCVLLGTDASPRIAKVGPAAAFRFMQAYDSIEEMLEGEPEVADRVETEAYLPMVFNARTLFTDLPPEEDVTARPLTYDDLTVKKWMWKHWRIWPRSRGESQDADTETNVRLVQERQSVPIELLEVEIDEILDRELWVQRAPQDPPSAPSMAFTEEELEYEIAREALRSENVMTYHQHNP
ncbi:5' flap endonuclease [Trichosporon asahii var. asahii CBS 8904]|uniref:Exonuclease 1 n=1 Tax=Trichosporon asahii var. asahii (strain CBS 8904) TaxID=1220162 RepID=K1VVG5_TRIAC|nr:5' flap endonuclease [Trichosporon asahii var. asahii CBS 8904]